MNTVTYDQVIAMNPCWLETPAGRYRLKRYADRLGGKATALDILALTRVPVADRLWLVLREEFIPAKILHEFACRCAERALRRAGVTDTRSWAAIRAKRDWLAGKIDDQQLADTTRDAARAAAQATAQAAAWYAAQATERAWQITELTNMLQEAEISDNLPQGAKLCARCKAGMDKEEAANAN